MNTPSRNELTRLFSEPPLEYGDLMTYFWECGTLSKEQLTWQLEQLKDKGVSGTWFYPRYVRGEPYGPHPHYWSSEWWEFYEHYIAEHERLGLIHWFADWNGQGYWQEKLRAESDDRPEFKGYRLASYEADARDGEALQLDVPAGEVVLSAAAWRKVQSSLDNDSRHDLADQIAAGKLTWQAPEGDWRVVVVCSQLHDLDYLNPHVMQRWFELYWEPHVERLGQYMNETIRGHLQDEVYALGGNIVYADSLLERFQAEKGYDPRPHLAGLFHDIGDFTDKIRCDYYEVMSVLLEENLYRPIFDWHEERDLLFSTIATWGRQDIMGQTYQYGDFFRLLRWFHITGNEDPGNAVPGDRRFTDAKFSSSVQHLYERQRAAMCVYWGSGHGMTQEQNLAWTNENYAYGLNMYNTHGGLYGSLGSWYEWVPPSVHFRQPYWQHWKTFADHVSRLSAVLSQGVHQADVAFLYPLMSIHANWLKGDHFTAAGDAVAVAALGLARAIYHGSIDLDFIDDSKIAEAIICGDRLEVAGTLFKVVVMPPMTTIRTETLEKLEAFYEAGGTIVAVRQLPTGSPEQGRSAPRIRELVEHVFGIPSSAEYIHTCEKHAQTLGSVHTNRNDQGGQAIFVPEHETHRNKFDDPGMTRFGSDVPAVISRAIEQDVTCSGTNVFHTHQKTGEQDVYFLYNVESGKRTLTFTFETTGVPEIWDSFTGRIIPHHRFERLPGRTRVRLEMDRYEGVLLVFNADDRPQVVDDNLDRITMVEPQAETISVTAECTRGGRRHVDIMHAGKAYRGQVRTNPAPAPLRLEGDWAFELLPTMDNRWGDWQWPATETMIGPQARVFRYHQETSRPGTELGWHEAGCDDAGWQAYDYSFGPYWLSLGPFDPEHEPDVTPFAAGDIDPNQGWVEHVYSQTMGHAVKEVYANCGGMHGVDEHFIYFPATGETANAVRYLITWVHVDEAGDWDFNFGSGSFDPDQYEGVWRYHLGGAGTGQQAWVNGRRIVDFGENDHVARVPVRLEQGLNTVLLKLVHQGGQPINVFAAFQSPDAEPLESTPPPPLLKWFAGGATPTCDVTPHAESRIGWYRFEAPSGTQTIGLTLNVESAEAWVNGQSVAICDGRIELAEPLTGVGQVALRLEQKPGVYAGAAIPEPVEIGCGPTRLPLGDWCDYALESYSGGAVYRKQFRLTAAQLDPRIILDLGRVQISAEVEINGKVVGVGLARPYSFDITDYVQEGENDLKVTVFNSLANHYSVTYPSTYVFEGQTVSGLLGPVELQFVTKVRITAVACD